MNRTCGWPGCDANAVTDRQPGGGSIERRYCRTHWMRGNGMTHGNGSHRTGRVRVLTEAQEADVVRRIRRFESPKALAREYGITVGTIRAIVKRA